MVNERRALMADSMPGAMLAALPEYDADHLVSACDKGLRERVSAVSVSSR